MKMELLGKKSGSYNRNSASWAEKVLRYIVIILGCFYITSYLVVALIRMRYQFELQWIEGASLVQMRRILAGQQIYVPPSLEYVSMIYTPLYFYVSAAVAELVGNGFLGLRLVSIISSLGCLAIIYKFVRKEGYGLWPAISACGLFAATYGLTTGWFDIARVDSLFLFLALGSLYLLRFAKSSLHLVAAGIIAAMAFQTKQTGLIVAAPMMIYAILVFRSRALYFAVTCLGLIAASAIIMNWVSSGWYSYFAWDIPNQHAIDQTKWIIFWFGDLMPKLFVSIAACLLYLTVGLDWNQKRKHATFYICATLGMIAAGWMGRLHNGGFINVVMPTYAWISILFGLEIGRRLERSGSSKSAYPAIIIYSLCIMQFASAVYNPLTFIPSREDYRAGKSLVQLIARSKGDVFIPFHPYLALLSGKRGFMHRMVASDIFRSKDKVMKDKLNDDLKEAISKKRFDLIILNDHWIRDCVSSNYKYAGRVFQNQSAFFPKTGLRTRPESIWKNSE